MTLWSVNPLSTSQCSCTTIAAETPTTLFSWNWPKTRRVQQPKMQLDLTHNNMQSALSAIVILMKNPTLYAFALITKGYQERRSKYGYLFHSLPHSCIQDACPKIFLHFLQLYKSRSFKVNPCVNTNCVSNDKLEFSKSLNPVSEVLIKITNCEK